MSKVVGPLVVTVVTAVVVAALSVGSVGALQRAAVSVNSERVKLTIENRADDTIIVTAVPSAARCLSANPWDVQLPRQEIRSVELELFDSGSCFTSASVGVWRVTEASKRDVVEFRFERRPPGPDRLSCEL